MTFDKLAALRSVRKFVATIPIFGPLMRRGYRLLIDGYSPNQSVTSKRNFFDTTVEHLDPCSILFGSAHFCSTKVAHIVEGAILKIADRLALIVFPSDRGNELHIGVKESDLTRFTADLSEEMGQNLRWTIDLDEWVDQSELEDPEDSRLNMPTWQKRLRREKRLKMNLCWPDGLSFVLKASIFYPAEEKFESRDSSNRFFRNIHHSLEPVMETPGLHLTRDLLEGTPIEFNELKVDVVYTWVNNSDPNWKQLYAEAKGVPHEYHEDAHSLDRFTNRDELRYSIRSVLRYLPWVDKIYVFSNCAPPNWFDHSDRVHWVMHDEVIPEKYLPTFNSHAIETYLHQIPGLSEYFLYFNDDFFVNEALPKSYFFKANGLTVANLEDYGVVNGAAREEDKDYLNAARNSAQLMRSCFDKVPTRLHKHAPYPLRVSILKQLEKRFPDAFAATRKAQFRSATDHSVASFLYHHFAYATGAGVLQGYRSQIIKNSSPNYKRDLRRMKEGSGVRAFCINDGEKSHEDDGWNLAVVEFLEKRYPIPHKYENILIVDEFDRSEAR